MLSSKASQSLTYHCFNSVGYKNKAGKARQALQLMTWNDLELAAPGTGRRAKFKYSVPVDECQVRDFRATYFCNTSILAVPLNKNFVNRY